MVPFTNIRELDQYLEKQAAHNKFSGVVLIAKDGVPLFQKAYGLASKRFNVPNKIDTKFNIGSINKVFTSVAIMQLLEKGKLTLDDTISKYLPDFPREVADKITIRHLLQHRSGMGHYWDNEKYKANWTRFRTVADYIDIIKDEPLNFEPGTSRQYSNSGYEVLGAIIEKVSGQDYYDYIRENIYNPAGMTNTDSHEMDVPVENLAIGYTNLNPFGPKGEGYQRNNMFLHSIKGTPAGGGYSTAEDLLKFVVALYNNKLLSPKYTDIMFNRYNDVETPGKRPQMVAFAGGAPGINAVMEMNFENRHTVIVLSNYDPPTAIELGKSIMKMLTEK